MSSPNLPPQPPQPGATQPTTPLPGQPGGYGAPQGGGQPGYANAGQQPTQQQGQQGQQPQAAPAGYGQSPAAYTRPAGPAPATTLGQTNTFAFLAIIFAFLSPIAGIVFGHMGLSQIKRTGDAGRGIALTGLIISYAYFVFLALFIIVYVGFIITMIGTFASLSSSYSSY